MMDASSGCWQNAADVSYKALFHLCTCSSLWFSQRAGSSDGILWPAGNYNGLHVVSKGS